MSKMHTDYNVIVPIPQDAHRCNDNRVYVVLQKRYFQDLRYNMDRREWIGKAISDTEMHPNDNYRKMYPEAFTEITHLNLPQYVKRTGMYAAVLATAESIGLYEDLRNNLGPRSANLVLDYAMYSILTKSNAIKDFETVMADQMLFLDKVYSDSWFQKQFDTEINDTQIQAFKYAWLKRFSEEERATGVWFCIDGSNNDCTADIDEAEKGKSKSHKNIDIVSFLYAVTDDGAPIISQIYRGSRVDSQALKDMIALIAGYGVRIKGVILDRGFCDENCIKLLYTTKYDFVIMMKENTNGYHELLDKYQYTIKLKWKYALGNGLFGTDDTVKLFKGSDLETHASIIWDGKNGIERGSYLIDEVIEAVAQAELAIAEGKTPKIPDKYKSYIKIVTKEGMTEVIVVEEKIQKEIESKGFYGLICSRQMSADEADNIYNLRNCSEKQYSLMKTQLGDEVFRAHNMHRIRIRELVAFVASVIRQKLMTHCRDGKPVIDTNVAIKELNLINMHLIGNRQYKVIPQQSKRQREIMRRIGIKQENLDYIAAYETKRFNGEAVSPIHTLGNRDTLEEKGKTTTIKGIPTGSKAKGKGSRSDTVTQEEQSRTEEKRKPGRPRGSKNKPKINNETPTEKRGRGRPKGSKNRPKD